MSTFREAVYLVLDMFKSTHDDAHFTPEHILFLLDKYRSFVLKSKAAKDVLGNMSYNDNYQTIEISLEEYNPEHEEGCVNNFLRSTNKVPTPADFALPEVFGDKIFSKYIIYVDDKRFKYIGNNKYLKNFIYCTIGSDGYFYMKSCNPNYNYLDKVNMSAIFDSCLEAAQCQADGKECDMLDMVFPLEDSLLMLVCDYIINELSQATYRPADVVNNATDDLAGLSVPGDNVRYPRSTTKQTE